MKEDSCAERNDNCVKQTLAKILAAQNRAASEQDCGFSCEASINQMRGKPSHSGKNTIPFILYDRNNKPFEAKGAVSYTDCCGAERLCTVKTFVFKVKQLKNSCATIELLYFDRDESDEWMRECCCNPDGCTIECQIDNEKLECLAGTGVCLNINVSCFCGVQCLPPVSL